jgi:hypothetical protein
MSLRQRYEALYECYAVGASLESGPTPRGGAGAETGS